MKRLNTVIMRKLLQRGIKIAKRFGKVKSPDYCISLFTHELSNGWYYQVENTFWNGVVVFAFRPPRVYHAKSAEYYLAEKERKR